MVLQRNARFVANKIIGDVTESIIINDKFKEDHILIPRTPTVPTNLPNRKVAIPYCLAFTMTVNKAQGQSMSFMSMHGLNRENSYLFRGQLYVACSRVGQPHNLFVYVKIYSTVYIVHEFA